METHHTDGDSENNDECKLSEGLKQIGSFYEGEI